MNASPADSRVLIVEDAPANIQALTAILREKGYAISIATNGRQALDVLAAVRPDLILLDVMMPEMDGFETCSRIKDTPDWRDIPIIFLTAKSETGDIVRGFELGAVDYVAKPFHAHELLARVHTHLAMDRLRRENEQLVRAESENARHRSVAQMVAGVAHEINTPLGVINTAASLLTRWLAEPVMVTLAKTADGQMMAEDLAEAAGLITRNAHRAHKLVQDFKKVSVNQITDVRETTSLAETIEETVNLFRATARQSPMQVLFTNTLAQPRGEWTGYPGSLSQVLLNLLSNAQRYAYPEWRRRPGGGRAVGGSAGHDRRLPNHGARLRPRHPAREPAAHLRAVFHHRARPGRQRPGHVHRAHHRHGPHERSDRHHLDFG
jgi:CheY-like chemotaxis protein